MFVRNTGMLLRSLVCTLALGCAFLASASEYKLVWSDEFDRPGQPDPKKWTYEEGFVRNNEEQYYTRDRRQNARVENGYLVIEARKEKYSNKFYKAGSTRWNQKQEHARYTSAALITQGLGDWKYGRIVVRARLPKGKGTWPAIWMLGADRGKVAWPFCGEIDILEQLGRMPEKVHGTIHWGVDPAKNKGKNHMSNGGLTVSEDDLSRGFNTYAIEWTEQKIDFYFNKTKYHSVDLSKMPEASAQQFRKPYYLLLNLAIGGSWGGEVDPGIFPQRILVDYVRIYQRQSK